MLIVCQVRRGYQPWRAPLLSDGTLPHPASDRNCRNSANRLSTTQGNSGVCALTGSINDVINGLPERDLHHYIDGDPVLTMVDIL
jgi:hypothetical protein